MKSNEMVNELVISITIIQTSNIKKKTSQNIF